MAQKFFVVPDIRTKSTSIKESSGVRFLCPANTVMTGRWHKGDENGQTQYEYATLKIVDENNNPVQGNIEVSDIKWSDAIKESSGSGFFAPENRVIVGRYHKGDENGTTEYATAVVFANGELVETIDRESHASFKESNGTWFVTNSERIIVGRVHKGDENGQTYYVTARLLIGSNLKEPAPEGTIIIPATREKSKSFKESDSEFLCPTNTVLTGRSHHGDENGTTIYEFSTLKAVNEKGELVLGHITIEDVYWEKVDNESSGKGFDAKVNRVIVGRKHKGDENGYTEYATAVVKFNGHLTYISDYTVSEIQKESSFAFESGINQVITSRQHYDDENGYTFYGLGTIYCHPQLKKNTLPFDLIVSLHEDESYYPMSASDFIILSRFRRHLPDNSSDMGYDKTVNGFIFSNSHSMNFYNIPETVINGCHSTNLHEQLFNVRPHDPLNIYGESSTGYFLQTFANLHGDTNPSGKVPVYVNLLEYLQEDGIKVMYIDFWLFFGYNGVTFLSHQGDWEHVMVEVVNDKIRGAWLSQHTSFEYYQGRSVFRESKQLEIVSIGSRQQLTIYCEKGSHALYAHYNEVYRNTDTEIPVSKVNTTRAGYKWKITDFMVNLNLQPWLRFGGAWGKVGELKFSTGPLGPWYKKYDFWYETPVSLSSILSSNEIAIVPAKYYISSIQKENANYVFEAPENMVMVGRKHDGDENGDTVCLYATLKAINLKGASVQGTIKVIDTQWTDWIKENDSKFLAPEGYVIVGRQHTGDENGNTRYKIGKITFNGRDVSIVNADSIIPYQSYKESMKVFFQTGKYCLFVGRIHHGDENGLTHNVLAFAKTNP